MSADFARIWGGETGSGFARKQVQDAASDEVFFPGAIYDKATVSALRFHSSLYSTAIKSAAPAGG